MRKRKETLRVNNRSSTIYKSRHKITKNYTDSLPLNLYEAFVLMSCKRHFSFLMDYYREDVMQVSALARIMCPTECTSAIERKRNADRLLYRMARDYGYVRDSKGLPRRRSGRWQRKEKLSE